MAKVFLWNCNMNKVTNHLLTQEGQLDKSDIASIMEQTFVHDQEISNSEKFAFMQLLFPQHDEIYANMELKAEFRSAVNAIWRSTTTSEKAMKVLNDGYVSKTEAASFLELSRKESKEVQHGLHALFEFFSPSYHAGVEALLWSE